MVIVCGVVGNRSPMEGTEALETIPSLQPANIDLKGNNAPVVV